MKKEDFDPYFGPTTLRGSSKRWLKVIEAILCPPVDLPLYISHIDPEVRNVASERLKSA